MDRKGVRKKWIVINKQLTDGKRTVPENQRIQSESATSQKQREQAGPVINEVGKM